MSTLKESLQRKHKILSTRPKVSFWGDISVDKEAVDEALSTSGVRQKMIKKALENRGQKRIFAEIRRVRGDKTLVSKFEVPLEKDKKAKIITKTFDTKDFLKEQEGLTAEPT